MKKLLIILAPALLFTNLSFAQPDTLWTRTYGGPEDDIGQEVITTLDGGFAVFGKSTYPGTNSTCFYLVKVDADGDTLWTRRYGNPELDSGGQSIKQSSDGSFILSGYSENPLSAAKDILVIKTTSSGDVIWDRTYGDNSSTASEWVYSIQNTTDGGYIFTGETNSFGAQSHDLFIMKIDEDGDSLWMKLYGGEDIDAAYHIECTDDGGYIAVGRTESYNTGIYYNIWLVKTDEFGDTLWTKVIGESNQTTWGQCVQQTDDGGYIVSGNVKESGDFDYYIVKLDDNGEIIWTKTYGSEYVDAVGDIRQLENGGYLIVGSMNFWFASGASDVWIIQTDENGDSTWSYIFDAGYNDVTGWSCLVEDGFAVGGWSDSYGSGDRDFLLMRFANYLPVIPGQQLSNLPRNYHFFPAFPNPFNPETILSFTLPESEKASLIVYNLLGNEVVRLIDEYTSAGTHDVLFDAGDLPAGIYFVRLTAGDYVGVRKLVLIK